MSFAEVAATPPASNLTDSNVGLWPQGAESDVRSNVGYWEEKRTRSTEPELSHFATVLKLRSTQP